MKMEYLHMNPNLVRVHDFIRDEKIELIKSLAYLNMTRSKVFHVDKNISTREVSMSRTSVNSWIFYKSAPELIPQFKTIEYLMDLNAAGEYDAEALQVVTYGTLGSHYVPHTDMVRKCQI